LKNKPESTNLYQMSPPNVPSFSISSRKGCQLRCGYLLGARVLD